MDIRIDQLTKRFGPQTAVDAITFTVRTGEVLGFLGPNGAGKSTTMKMICGLLAPDRGTIEVGGRSVLDDPGSVRRHIGYLPENNPLYEDMPVLDFLRFTAKVQGVDRGRTDERIREMVDVCGLDPEKHKRIGELSKGYRQRVGLAQAMVHDPEVLILDEPTSGLDPNQIVEIRELIKEVGRAKTVIFSTHILPEVEATCDRILIINKGRIVADGSPEQLRQQAQGKALLRVRIEDGASDAVQKALGVLPGVTLADVVVGAQDRFDLQCEAPDGVAREVFRLCVDRGWTLTELRSMGSSLEDVFRDLTLN
ncbi:MAG: ATP-binding cassette domain-containing protein [Flavobacteriales bacterium]|nr:ATP-binding cassette domain-containing protein [Flavobacteriales bacterium]MCB9167928.1 ATP-binding cassette domain-containing protein [Flavobacteriales bacterium]